MPEHYADWWYEDLPEGARKAAAVLGWSTKEKWDESEDVPFKSKSFSDLTLSEKRAAMFLGIDIIETKLDIWWEETDEETKQAALAVGWTQEKWDDDWELEDLPIEEKYWSDLTEEERAGVSFFGYMQCTWDETDETAFDDEGAAMIVLPTPSKKESNEEKKEEEDAEEAEAEEETADDDEKKEAKKKKKKRFAQSKYYGGEGGADFDDHNRRHIAKITVRSGVVVDAIQCTYAGGVSEKHGGNGGGEHSLDLGDDEYVTSIIVRHANLVQCLTFITNKGNQLGPCGGKGRMLQRDPCGEEEEVKAPSGMKLIGIMGRCGALLDAIAFRWGPIGPKFK